MSRFGACCSTILREIYIYIVFLLGRCIIWDKMDGKIVEKKCVLVHLKNEINDNNSVLIERDLQLSSYYLKSKSIRLSYESFSFFSVYYKFHNFIIMIEVQRLSRNITYIVRMETIIYYNLNEN